MFTQQNEFLNKLEIKTMKKYILFLLHLDEKTFISSINFIRFWWRWKKHIAESTY